MIDSGVVLTSSRYKSKKSMDFNRSAGISKEWLAKVRREWLLPEPGSTSTCSPASRMSTFEKQPTLLRKSATVWVFWKFFSICYRNWWTALVFVNDFTIFLSIHSTILIRSSVMVHSSNKNILSNQYLFIQIYRGSISWKF